MFRVKIIYTLLVLTLTFLSQESWSKVSCELQPQIRSLYLRQHALKIEDDEVLRQRVTERIIKTLDPAKMYFTQKDIEKIKNFRVKTSLSSDCKKFFEIYNLFLQKMDITLQEAKKTLVQESFKVNPNTKIVFDHKKRKFYETEKERKAFLLRLFQFQVQSRLDITDSFEDAKAKTLASYKRQYKSAKSRTTEDVVSLYLTAFASALDPHSSYLSREDLEEFQIYMSLSLEGIGTSLEFRDGYTVIVNLVPGGGAERSGKVKPEDKIIAVAQGRVVKEWVDIFEMDPSDVVRLIRGKKGTTVHLRVLRKVNGKNKRLDITLVRDKINLEDNAAAIYYINKKKNGKNYKVGIIHLPSFYYSKKRRASSDIYNLIKEAKKEKVNSLVLDLSFNGGGALDDSVRVAGLFLKKPSVVRQARNSKETKKGHTYKDPNPSVSWDGPLVVLVNRQSASASEIVSGALKDYGRAIVVGGKQTYGKGTVQVVQQVDPRGVTLGALKVTVGMFFLPGGQSTQYVGVNPDVQIPELYELVSKEKNIGEKAEDYSLPPQVMASFLSPAKKSWPIDKRITAQSIEKIQALSKKRVKKSKAFKKLFSEVKKAKKNNDKTEWRLSELKTLQEEEKSEKKDRKARLKMTSKEKQKKYLERADIQEVGEIALDLFFLNEHKSSQMSKTFFE